MHAHSVSIGGRMRRLVGPLVILLLPSVRARGLVAWAVAAIGRLLKTSGRTDPDRHEQQRRHHPFHHSHDQPPQLPCRVNES